MRGSKGIFQVVTISILMGTRELTLLAAWIFPVGGFDNHHQTGPLLARHEINLDIALLQVSLSMYQCQAHTQCWLVLLSTISNPKYYRHQLSPSIIH